MAASAPGSHASSSTGCGGHDGGVCPIVTVCVRSLEAPTGATRVLHRLAHVAQTQGSVGRTRPAKPDARAPVATDQWAVRGNADDRGRRAPRGRRPRRPSTGPRCQTVACTRHRTRTCTNGHCTRARAAGCASICPALDRPRWCWCSRPHGRERSTPSACHRQSSGSSAGPPFRRGPARYHNAVPRPVVPVARAGRASAWRASGKRVHEAFHAGMVRSVVRASVGRSYNLAASFSRKHA